MMRYFLLFLCLQIASNTVLAKDKTKLVTLRGTVSFGTLDSSIDNPNGDVSAIFITNSKVGQAILTKCETDDICEVTGLVVGSGTEFPKIVSVKKVKAIKAGNE
jgi:hypothetical protein